VFDQQQAFSEKIHAASTNQNAIIGPATRLTEERKDAQNCNRKSSDHIEMRLSLLLAAPETIN
jgi:hypothetical protein